MLLRCSFGCLLVGLVVSLSTARAASSVTLAWSPPTPSTGIAGYRLYDGTTSQTYSNMFDLGNSTNGTVTGLTAGRTYYFAVTAYDIVGLESPFSGEVSYTVPGTNAQAKLQLTMKTNPKRAVLSGTAPVGYVYDVLSTTNLSSWSKLGSVTSAVSGTLTYTNSNPTGLNRFYKLKQTSP
jgi:hypothetical protein